MEQKITPSLASSSMTIQGHLICFLPSPPSPEPVSLAAAKASAELSGIPLIRCPGLSKTWYCSRTDSKVHRASYDKEVTTKLRLGHSMALEG